MGSLTAPELKLTPIDGGYRVKLNAAGTHYIDILEMVFNWRIVESPARYGDTPLTYDRGWCYINTSKALSFRDAVLAAWIWDGSQDTEPPGYGKALQRHEYLPMER